MKPGALLVANRSAARLIFITTPVIQGNGCFHREEILLHLGTQGGVHRVLRSNGEVGFVFPSSVEFVE